MRIKHQSGAAAIVHEGKTFEPDEDGFIDVPFELALSLLQTPGWETEEPRVFVPEPEPELEEQDPAGGAENPGGSPDSGEELTPAQKGALTKAANAAKAAAEAEAKTKK